MKKTRHQLILILLMLVYPVMGCMSTGFISQLTPTATGTVIYAKENQTPGIPTDPPVDTETNCLKTAAGAVNVGDPCIIGSYSAHYNIVQRPNDHETIVTDSLMEAHLTIWAVAVGKLQGIAHMNYSLKSKLEDPTSPTCQTSSSIVTPFGWDVRLKGQYFSQSDGTLQFLIQADPIHGPEYDELFPDCPDVPTRHENGIIWNGASGKFENGVYHMITDSPIPSDATGRFYTEILIEVVK